MAGLTHDLLNIAYFAFGANGCFLVGTQWSRTRFGRITIHWKRAARFPKRFRDKG
ncbi:hypothetical protein FOTG_11176 [Fusarium oxysporum f. sp. vasinfectum 25433]|uniref:Uncharacterized protein n=1 Tax=Fusarium oxysporum f. sp. vasinfectum 25433 TaxID=1089449 RepID=X0L562_FUSOX|nr:hypothetical protein FOTG_11176 [Fusarium oxysporum f. sp. vasinfectum 25433]